MITVIAIVLAVAAVSLWGWFVRDAYRNSERGKAEQSRKRPPGEN